MFRFLFSTLYAAVTLLVLVRWGRRQSERQIDKMQEAAFNTPGAVAPVPPGVVVSSAGVLFSHFIVGQKALKLRGWQTLLSLLLGAGAATFVSQKDAAL